MPCSVWDFGENSSHFQCLHYKFLLQGENGTFPKLLFHRILAAQNSMDDEDLIQCDVPGRAHERSQKPQALPFGSCVTMAKSLISLNLFPQLQNRNNTGNTCSMYSTRLTGKAIPRQLYANVLYSLKKMVIAVRTNGKNNESPKNQSLCF